MHRTLPILITIAACSGAPPTDDVGSTTDTSAITSTSTPSTSAFAATATLSPEVGMVVFVTWETPTEGSSWVDFGLDGALSHSTAAAESGPTHEVTLLGLKAGTTYSFQANTEAADGTVLSSEVGTITTGGLLPGQPQPTLTTSDPSSTVADGYVLYSLVMNTGDSFVQMVDGDGDVVWARKALPGRMIVSSRMSRDGQSVMYAEHALGASLDLAQLHRVSLDGRDITTTHLPNGHHDFEEMSDGSIGFYAYVTDDANNRASDAILELAEGSDESITPTTVFNYWSDYPHPYWYVCEHVNGWQANTSYDEWTHSNSLMSNDAGYTYFSMSKFHDSLVKISRATGAVEWQLNGLHDSGFTTTAGAPVWSGVGDSVLFSHAHMSHIWETPQDPAWTHCMAVFDNGYHYAPTEWSSAIEVCLNEDTMKAERVWEHGGPGFTSLMGDVRKLDDSYLVGWATFANIEEIGNDHTVRWSLAMGANTTGARVSWVPSLP
jgi:hypothetical protein